MSKVGDQKQLGFKPPDSSLEGEKSSPLLLRSPPDSSVGSILQI